MCTLKLHPKVIEHLDKLRRYCLWAKNSDDGVKNNSLAAWELVCRPKNKGGLAVIDIKTQNAALLLKHLFKFYNHHDVPWVTLIWDTYYSDRVPHAVDQLGSFWWRDVFKLYDKFCQLSVPKVHSGEAVLFWLDHWQLQGRNTPMKDRFPRLYPFVLDDMLTVKASMIYHPWSVPCTPFSPLKPIMS